MDRPKLLSIIELGGYPDFSPLYRELGCEVLVETSMRKALAAVRRHRPQLVVAEFNFQSDFRDRTSSLESLQGAVQRLPQTRVIVFYEQEFAHQLQRLQARFELFRTLTYPIDPERLAAAVRDALAGSGAAQ
ncbi:hypothetical protein QVG61_03145 [Thiohalobacter sp. IOR34]|uniref:hypothetical protein n=1 Tax=Thiohalobacter sp. IOR34 TaxID=3057176 RepID=UPI0025B19A6F|nr:hypothetical protein [Thiohalobacter sp. IOR34]WJW76103.1 hypothetical protein QVG61_03145 [Thiohalobacter sp. IOR34]